MTGYRGPEGQDAGWDAIAHAEAPSDSVSLIAPHLPWRRHALLLQEGLHVAAVHVASLLGCDDGEGFDFEAMEIEITLVLEGLLQQLESCAGRLQRLHVDFECLDDGEAEGLFGCSWLRDELEEIQEVQGECMELQKRATGWLRCCHRASSHVMGLDALADFLGAAVREMDRLVQSCGAFAAKRRAAVARAKAAIETADAEERSSAVGLLQEALSPPARVDFPRITEICQRVADRPEEAEQSAAMLWQAFTSTEANAEVPRRQLKALTIAHELLYDDRVLTAFTAQDTEPLRGLESSSPGLGRAAEEAMRMLAAEVRRRVEDARRRRGRRCLTWSFGMRGTGDAEGSPVQPKLRSSKSMPLEVSQTELEALLRRLRRWGSWYRFKGEELPLLEALNRDLGEVLNALGRLREELCCLDDGSSVSLPLSAAVEELGPLLAAAAQLQAGASSWCQAFSSDKDLETAVDREKLAEFIEEALAAEASLQRQLQRFRRLRFQAVEKAKAFIEAGAMNFEVS